jgi:hypothetical protein
MKKELKELIELLVDIATATSKTQQKEGRPIWHNASQSMRDIRLTNKDPRPSKTKSGLVGMQRRDWD